MKNQIILMLSIALIFSASCKKTATIPTNNNNNTTGVTAPTPSPGPGDGVIVSVKSITNTNVGGFPVNTEFGTGVAAFGNLATGVYQEAGNVTLEGKTLTKQNNNSYTFVASATDPLGISFSGTHDWNVSGGAGMTAFNHSASKGFPSYSDMSAFTSINSANSFDLKVTGSISNSDSVYFIIGGTNTTIVKRFGGGTTSATFSASELQSIGKGTVTAMIVPWNWVTETINGKTIHVVNEIALSRIVDLN